MSSQQQSSRDKQQRRKSSQHNASPPPSSDVDSFVDERRRPRSPSPFPRRHGPLFGPHREPMQLRFPPPPTGKTTGALRLDLNLEAEVRVSAHVHGDLTLALLS
ncbi:predicted protein [Lichtheimia corymbifera JMRC:FSU:9682]|uniref:Uncharacterized protein n=1 Tax=Lichtheimia corymbifera JMRC:FSU:9682 TaxID=1263082 RepID=A0A068RX50_9FUNG|nr:predicted protein [Lichtheimia corymbifera JMRC:FSU:9682]